MLKLNHYVWNKCMKQSFVSPQSQLNAMKLNRLHTATTAAAPSHLKPQEERGDVRTHQRARRASSDDSGRPKTAIAENRISTIPELTESFERRLFLHENQTVHLVGSSTITSILLCFCNLGFSCGFSMLCHLLSLSQCFWCKRIKMLYMQQEGQLQTLNSLLLVCYTCIHPAQHTIICPWCILHFVNDHSHHNHIICQNIYSTFILIIGSKVYLFWCEPEC